MIGLLQLNILSVLFLIKQKECLYAYYDSSLYQNHFLLCAFSQQMAVLECSVLCRHLSEGLDVGSLRQIEANGIFFFFFVLGYCFHLYFFQNHIFTY